jgi:hypothetical protein
VLATFRKSCCYKKFLLLELLFDISSNYGALRKKVCGEVVGREKNGVDARSMML